MESKVKQVMVKLQSFILAETDYFTLKDTMLDFTQIDEHRFR